MCIGLLSCSQQDQKLVLKQQAAIEFIKQVEGYRSIAYKDSRGAWKIGYGTPAKKGERIGQMFAEIRLQTYLKHNVFKHTPEKLSLNQYVVYSSLEYNLGGRRAKAFLTKKGLDCKRILLYNKVENKTHKGIINRREREYKLCVK